MYYNQISNQRTGSEAQTFGNKMELNPLDIDLIHYKIIEYVGLKYAPCLRLINSAWSSKALSMVAAAGTTAARVTPANVQDILTSTQMRLRGLQITLDFGSGPSKDEFYSFIEAASTSLGSDAVTTVKFSGPDFQFRMGASDWLPLQNLLLQNSFTLRRLHLFQGDGDSKWSSPSPDRVYLPSYFERQVLPAWEVEESAFDLVLPQLEEFVVGWPQCATWVFEALLRPRVMPKLDRLKIKIPKKPESYMRRVYLYCLRTSLRHLSTTDNNGTPRLTELEFTTPGGVDSFLQWPPAFQLAAVRRLTLRIVSTRTWNGKSGDYCDDQYGVGINAGFIAPIFPGLTYLSLQFEYDPSVSCSKFGFGDIGSLTNLESLSYGIWGLPDAEQAASFPRKLTTFVRHGHTETFPALRSVSVDLALQLEADFDRKSQTHLQIEFQAVSRLEIQMGFPLHPESIQSVATNLHRLHPHVNRLALNFGQIRDGEGPKIAARIVIEEFSPLEELEFLQCPPELLAEIWADNEAHVAPIRRLTLQWEQAGLHEMVQRDKRLSLTGILSKCTRLDWIEADEGLLAAIGGSTVTAVYAEAYELQRMNPSLKIKLN